MSRDRSSAARWNGAVGQVFAYSRARGAAFTLMLTVAQHVNERTGLARVGDERLASLSRLDPKTVKRAIRTLQVELGELLVVERGSARPGEKRVPTTYQLMLAEAEPPLFEPDDGGHHAPGPAAATGGTTPPVGYPQPGALSPATGGTESRDGGHHAPLTLLYAKNTRARAAIGLVERKARQEVPRMLDRLAGDVGDDALAHALAAVIATGDRFTWCSQLDRALERHLTTRRGRLKADAIDQARRDLEHRVLDPA